MSELFIGLMSGTSVDGIDAVVVDFSTSQPQLIASHYYPYSPELRSSILSLCTPGDNEINRLGEMDVALGKAFATAVNQLLEQANISPHHIHAIGSHGQTIRHHPNKGFTLQIGDPNIITAETGITTIADFRRRDIAHGGQGAPLVPAFHQEVLGSKTHDRAIVNIGGIANVTLLPASGEWILGFDTGPGNTLLDAWIETHLQQAYDKKGEWAAEGKVNQALLDNLLNDMYFKLPAPKSTGREYFHLNWLKQYSVNEITPVDMQATLSALTARSIVQAIHHYLPESEVFICGGGVHNDCLLQQLSQLAKGKVVSTQNAGVDPDWMEAMAFAWLAKQTFSGKPGNLTAVTGSSQTAILGGIYRA